MTLDGIHIQYSPYKSISFNIDEIYNILLRIKLEKAKLHLDKENAIFTRQYNTERYQTIEIPYTLTEKWLDYITIKSHIDNYILSKTTALELSKNAIVIKVSKLDSLYNINLSTNSEKQNLETFYKMVQMTCQPSKVNKEQFKSEYMLYDLYDNCKIRIWETQRKEFIMIIILSQENEENQQELLFHHNFSSIVI